MPNPSPTKKTIVFIAWKDILHPATGGAEKLIQEISKRLVSESGYRVIHLVPGFKDCPKTEIVNGVEIRRVGTSMLHFYALPFVFKKELSLETDILVDVFNCFGSFSYLGFRGKKVFYLNHIQDNIWFYQTVFPFVPPFNLVGWLMEKAQLFLASHTFNGKGVVICNSTKEELQDFGFKKPITVIRVGADTAPVAKLPSLEEKYENFTVTYFGSQRPMKRPEEALAAFILFNQKYPQSRMIIAGVPDKEHTPKLEKQAQEAGVADKVQFIGKTTLEQKAEIMRKTHLLLVTSVKEGWGMIVTEANSQGTPAVTYSVAGLRDSNDQGLITEKNTPENLCLLMEKAYQDPVLYEQIRQKSWQKSLECTFENSYLDFLPVLDD